MRRLPVPGGDSDALTRWLDRVLPRHPGAARKADRSASWVIPGHGAPIARARALEILEEDDWYLAQLATEPDAASPPRSRAGAAQARIHEANRELLELG